MNTTNLDIRVAMAAVGMKQWQLAKLLNMHESALSKKMRDELEPDEKAAILKVIKGAKEYDA